MTSFVHTGTANRVVFGAGSITQLPAEVDRLGRGRVLTVAGAGRPIRRGRPTTTSPPRRRSATCRSI